MPDSLPTLARCASSVLICLALVGCDDGGLEPTDAGPRPMLDAGSLPDGGALPDGGDPVTGCRADADCDDGNTCTENSCFDGECYSARVDGCFECATNADCDSGFTCAIAECVGGICDFQWDPACECLNDSECDDGDPTTTDRCVGNVCERTARTCTDATECDDLNSCTTDDCVSGVCQSTAIPGCGSCPDRDGDGHATRFCIAPGDDCNDSDPAIHPGATEDCSDGVDNNCDGRVDLVDSACSTGATTCMGVPTVTPGTTETGAIVSDPSVTPMPTPCGASNYYTLVVPALSDIEITVTLEPPPPPTPVPGCPECTPSHEYEYQYNVFLESTCGDPATDVGGAGGGCYIFGNTGFGGSGTRTVSLRRVPAGTYTIDVQASDFFGWMLTAIQYSLDVTMTPSAAASCGTAGALTEGVSVPGNAMSGVDAFGTDCRGRVATAEEALHTFTLTERRRVRLEAAGVLDPMWSSYPGLQLGLYGACDPSATRLACQEHSSSSTDCYSRSTLEEVLDPGTYWLVVEANGGTPSYDLTLTTEAVGAACAGAPVVNASAALMGDTTGATDAFRDPDVCGQGYAGDRVYQLDLAADSRVVLDLVASYANAMLTLYEGCGEARLAGGRGRSRIDTILSAGTYYVVAGGDRPGDEGTYVLNATIVPAPPTP